jgi:hypothetical protein
MMKRISVSVLTAFMTLCPSLSLADDDLKDLQRAPSYKDWVLVKNDERNGIRLFVKHEEDKRFMSFRQDYVVNAPLKTVARVMLDLDNYPRWYWEVKEVKLLKVISPTEFYFYIRHNAPVTLPDRDSILHVTLVPYNSRKGFASIKMEAAPHFLPEKPPYVRIMTEDMAFKMTPINNGTQVRFEVEAYVDPSGFAPKWATNAVQRQGPYSTALGMIRRVQDDTVRNATEPLPFKLIEDE